MKFCKKCNCETDRYSSGDCRPCGARMGAAAYAKNRDKRLALAAVYRAENVDKIRASQADYRERNKDKKKIRDAAYRAKQNKESVRLYNKAYYVNNIEKIRVASASYRLNNRSVSLAYIEKNKERLRSALMEWRAKNRERMSASNAAWRRANPEARRVIQQNRTARKRANGGPLSKGIIAKLFSLQNGKCPCCHKPLGDNYHLDHIIPIALGGKNSDDNVQLLRQRCNNEKYNKHPIDFMQQKGFLL